MLPTLRRILTATFASVAGLLVVLGVCIALQALGGSAEFFGGDKWSVLIPLCIGLPLGNLVGIALAERRAKGPISRMGLVISLWTALGGVCIVVVAMDLLGVAVIVLAPLIATTAGYAGYGIISRFPKSLRPS